MSLHTFLPQIFGELSPDDLHEIAAEFQPRTVDRGEVLIREGDDGDAFYVLLSGRMRVSTAASGEVDTIGAGDGFGEVSLLTAGPRTATVQALALTRRLIHPHREGIA